MLEQLMKKEEQLLENLDEIVYKEKFEKAIYLLKEVFGYLPHPTINIECEECDCRFEIDLDDVIDKLEILYKIEFCGYEIEESEEEDDY